MTYLLVLVIRRERIKERDHFSIAYEPSPLVINTGARDQKRRLKLIYKAGSSLYKVKGNEEMLRRMVWNKSGNSNRMQLVLFLPYITTDMGLCYEYTYAVQSNKYILSKL